MDGTYGENYHMDLRKYREQKVRKKEKMTASQDPHIINWFGDNLLEA